MSTLKVAVNPADHIQGGEHADCTLVEYGDYECPHCGHAYPIVKSIQKRFGKRLRFVFRNFPLNESHPHAQSAAESAEFAGGHGKFWEMHDLLFENQDRLSGHLYLELARQVQLAPAELQQALEERKYRAKVHADFSGGVRSGVNCTPTFFINGRRRDGPFEWEDLMGAIEEALA
jgi:protein-disulfide isomerase